MVVEPMMRKREENSAPKTELVRKHRRYKERFRK